MNSGNGAFAFAAFASDAKDKLWNDVEELAFGGKLVDLTLDFGSFVVSDRHECPLDTL